MSKPAYLVVDARVTDPDRILKYRELAGIAVANCGGRYLVRGGMVESLEGDWRPERIVIVQFDSAETVRRFYDSPEYRAASGARRRGGVRHAARPGLLTMGRTRQAPQSGRARTRHLKSESKAPVKHCVEASVS